MPNWAVAVLAMQLVLTFLAPPLAVGTRFIFASDIWCWLWVGYGILDLVRSRSVTKSLVRSFLKYFGFSASLLVVVYLHGYFRPSLLEQMAVKYYFHTSQSDLFNPLKEWVVCLRFLSWLGAAGLTAVWFNAQSEAQNRRAFEVLYRTLAASLIAVVVLMLLEKFIPSANLFLANLYSFDPVVDQWRNRVHGPFRSPVEAGTTLTFAALLFVARKRLSNQLTLVAVFAAVLGILMTKTVTPVMAVAVMAFLLGVAYVQSKLKDSLRWTLPLLVVVGSVALGVYGVKHSLFVEGKLHDLLFRFGPWATYLGTLVQRPDFLLLGLGFAPYHTDNAYVFLLTRGGLLGFGSVLWFLGRFIGFNWKHIGRNKQSVIAYLLIVGMALDAWIYRHIVALIICIAVPMFASKSERASSG